MYYSTTYPSLLGLLTLASDGMNLVGLWVEGQKYFGDPIKEAMANGTTCRCFLLQRAGWTGILQGKDLPSLRFLCVPSAASSAGKYGTSYARFPMER